VTLETKTATLESMSKTEAAKVVTLETKTTALESMSKTEAAKVVTLETKTATLESMSKTEAAKVVTLETKTATLESTLGEIDLPVLAGKITTLESSIALKSDSLKVSALELKVAHKETILQKNGITADTTLASTVQLNGRLIETTNNVVSMQQSTVTALETSLTAEKVKVTALETTLAAEQTKMAALETALAILTKKVSTINTQCLNDEDSSRRLASKPCGVLQQNTATSNQVLVQSLTFTGIQASDIASSSKMKNIEMKIANALDVKASRIKIIKITNTKVDRQPGQRRFLAEENGVELLFEVTIEGDEAAITAKGEELSASGSAVHTAVVAAVASEAGVDASSVTMTSKPMGLRDQILKASPTYPFNYSKDLENTAESDTSTGFSPMHVALIVMAIVVVCGALCVWKHKRDLAGQTKQGRQTKGTTIVTIEMQSNPMR